MRKLACALLVIIIVFSALVFIPKSHAAYVNSPITTNTTWTRANSPYTLTANIVVNSGVTLTVEPGVTVNFGSYQMQVNGVLNARGNSNNKIVFTSSSYSSQKIEFSSSSTGWSDVAGSGCIIDNAIISSVPISVTGASPKISNNYVTATSNLAVSVSGGSPSILNNVIIFRDANAIYLSGGATIISGNTISGQGQHAGIYIQGSASASISNNNILNGWEGIDAAGYCTITQNNIMNNGNDAIHTTNSGSIIQNNALANNKVGVSGTGGTIGTVQNNTIANNWDAGIWGPTTPAIIKYNNIIANYENIHLTENHTDVNATYNWWGTAITSEISLTIWDSKNASNLGTVNFENFLTESNPSAPTVPASIPVPTPPPTPAPTSTASPTPTPTPTPKPTATVAPTQQPTNAPTPYVPQTPTPTPYETPYETPLPASESPAEISNEGDVDLTSIAVISLAIMTTIIIVAILNIKFGRSHQQPPMQPPAQSA